MEIEFLILKNNFKETNPYIHNENGNYVGPTGLELMEIMEKTKKVVNRNHR